MNGSRSEGEGAQAAVPLIPDPQAFSASKPSERPSFSEDTKYIHL